MHIMIMTLNSVILFTNLTNGINEESENETLHLRL